MEELVKDAIGLGINEICITGHVSLGIKKDWTDNLDTYDYREKEKLPPMSIKYPAYLKRSNH